MILSHALRAVQKSKPTSFVDANALTNQTSDASRTLTLSTHSVGDMLVVMTGNRTATSPTLLSGYTNIVSDFNTQTATRSYRVQYKIATTTSETISWTGAYGFIVAVRNATSIGVTNTYKAAAVSSTMPLPDLTGLDVSGNASVLAGTYYSSGITSTTSPYTVYAPSGTANRFAAVIQGNTNASITGETITGISSNHTTWAIELLP